MPDYKLQLGEEVWRLRGAKIVKEVVNGRITNEVLKDHGKFAYGSPQYDDVKYFTCTGEVYPQSCYPTKQALIDELSNEAEDADA